MIKGSNKRTRKVKPSNVAAGKRDKLRLTWDEDIASSSDEDNTDKAVLLDSEDDSDETDTGDKGLGGAELIIEAEDNVVDQSQADVQAGEEGNDTQEEEASEAAVSEDTQSDIQNGVVVAEAVQVTIVDAGPQE